MYTCMDWNQRQKNGQSPSWILATKEKNTTLVIPQGLKLSKTCVGWNTSLVNF